MEKKLRALIKEAMIERKNTGDGLRYQTYKNVLEKAQKTAKEKLVEVITDDFIFDAAKKELKQLEDTLQYVKPEDVRYTETITAMEYVKSLLPVMASAEDMMTYLVALNAEKNMGVCMKALKGHYGALCDGKVAQEVAKRYIT